MEEKLSCAVLFPRTKARKRPLWLQKAYLAFSSDVRVVGAATPFSEPQALGTTRVRARVGALRQLLVPRPSLSVSDCGRLWEERSFQFR